MARHTTGKLYTSGKKGYYYFRYTANGKDFRVRLLDLNGKPITREPEAKKAAARILRPLNESNRAEQLRILKNSLSDAEEAANQAKIELVNSKATIMAGWELFMSCPKRPASCKRYSSADIPPHTTAANYRSYYRRFAEWLKANHKEISLLGDITPEVAEKFMDAVRRENASGTYNKYLQFFNCFFDTLTGAQKISSMNPFQDIDRQEHRYNSKKPLSLEQITTLINSATGDMRILIALGYFTGLRLGDCCTLLWREIDLSRKVIERIPRKTEHTIKDRSQAVVKIGIPPDLFEMLTAIPENERHNYLLPDFAEKYLAGGDQQITKKILKHFKKCNIEVHRPGTGRRMVLDPETGKPMIDKATGKTKTTGTRAVVEMGFHSLRYSYISHNAEAGTPAAIIQKNAGHANPAMTEHYTKISDTAAVRYAEVLQLPACNNEDEFQSEREILHRLVDKLPLEQIRKLIGFIKMGELL